MNSITKSIFAVLLTAIWVNASEFVRNELLLKTYWTEHYQSLGIPFPSEPLNGAVWGLWGISFSVAIYLVSRKFDLLQATLTCWFMGFVLMWIVTWNLGVLPAAILLYAAPLALLETFVGTAICKRVAPE